MKKVLTGLIYAYFIFFPLGYLLRYKLFVNVPFNFLDFIIVITGFLTFLNFNSLKKTLKKSKFFKFQLLFIFAGIISLILNTLGYKDVNFITSMFYAVRYISVILLLGLYPQINVRINIRKLIVYSGSAFLILGLLQYLFVYDLRPFTYLGWDDHLYRLFSTFFDPNFAGLFYACFFVFLLYDISRNTFSKSFIQIFTAFFTFVAIYLTYSRSALLALAAGITILLILKGKIKWIFLSLVLLTFFLFLFKDSTIEGSNPLRTVSSTNRIYSLNQAIAIFKKNPIVGVGFDAFRYAQLRYETRSPLGAKKSNADAGTDNSLIFVLATTGVIGFALFSLGYFYLFKDLIINGGELGKYLSSILVSLFVGSLFINALFYIPIISWVFILIGSREKLAKSGTKP